MHRQFCLILAAAASISLCLPALEAQQFPFELRVRGEDSAFTVTNGSSLAFAVDGIGDLLTVTLDITYLGQTTAVFGARPQILGSSNFSVTGLDQPPLTLQANQRLTLKLTFRSTTMSLAQAQLSLTYSQAASPGAPSQVGTIQLDLRGQIPNFVVSYALESDGNVRSLRDGGSVRFDPTRVGQFARATVEIANQGSGPGVVRAVSVTGPAFRLFGLRLMPVSLPGGTGIQFELRYSPTEVGEDVGQIQIQLGEGASITAAIVGTSVGSSFTYELVRGTVAQAISSRERVVLPPTPVGEREVATVVVQNDGTADGTISTIAVSGENFAVADLPFLPATLAPTETLAFTLEHRPLSPGDHTGRLRVGNVIFDLTATGLGSDLRYSFSLGDSASDVVEGDQLFFSPMPIGSTLNATFTIRNIGPREAQIPSIGVNGNRSSFQLQDVPALPMVLQPSEEVNFQIRFTPVHEELATAQLLVGPTAFSLSGFGEKPERAPTYQFTGANGQQQLLAQPTIGLELAEAYPIPLIGILTLVPDTGNLVDDPAVQFASGGRQVSFRIPPNSRRAIFPNGADQAFFQTGSVAATLRFEPTFATEAGFDLTADNPLSLSLPAPATPPVLRTLVARRDGANVLRIVLIGHTPTRSLARMKVDFTPAAGSKIDANSFEFSLSEASTLWFGSGVSEAFGGQFSVEVPFTVEGGGASPNLGLASVSATISNTLGDSSPASTTQF